MATHKTIRISETEGLIRWAWIGDSAFKFVSSDLDGFVGAMKKLGVTVQYSSRPSNKHLQGTPTAAPLGSGSMRK